jgi:hypothetical protein
VATTVKDVKVELRDGIRSDMDIEQDSHAPASKESRSFIGERRVEVIGNPDFPFQISSPK